MHTLPQYRSQSALGPALAKHDNVICHANITQKEQVALNCLVEKKRFNTAEVQALNVWILYVDKPRSTIQKRTVTTTGEAEKVGQEPSDAMLKSSGG